MLPSMTTLSPTLRSCALALALLAASARPALPGDWKLDPARPAPDGRPVENEHWKESSCASCHENVAREWARTTHATAWSDPRFLEDLKDRRKPEACHTCHIPEPLSGVAPGAKPRARDASQAAWTNLGVDCNACHLGAKGEILGPLGSVTKAHATSKSPAFTSEGQSQLCIGCHATTVGPVIGIAQDFVETRQWEQGRSCVGCHMQALERAFVADPSSAAKLGDAPYATHAGRSHELQSPRDPAFLARAFTFAARLEQDEAVLEVKNACGHRVPGLIGREIELAVELLDEQGRVVTQAALAFDHQSILAVDETRTLPLGKRGAKLRIAGWHTSPGFTAKQRFLALELPVAH